MIKYKVSIETKSDTMMGSGESIPGIIDNDILYDSYGLPYMFAKTFKGLLREQMKFLKECAPNDYLADVDTLLGSSDKASEKQLGKLKFENVVLTKGVREAIIQAVDEGNVTRDEILDALTIIFISTRINNQTGTYEPHTLRCERMTRTDLLFETYLYLDSDVLDENEDKLIKDSIQCLQHIGSHKSKGKGHVHCHAEVVQ